MFYHLILNRDRLRDSLNITLVSYNAIFSPWDTSFSDSIKLNKIWASIISGDRKRSKKKKENVFLPRRNYFKFTSSETETAIEFFLKKRIKNTGKPAKNIFCALTVVFITCSSGFFDLRGWGVADDFFSNSYTRPKLVRSSVTVLCRRQRHMFECLFVK